jgi:DNA-binding IclR family transcriptional regulator
LLSLQPALLRAARDLPALALPFLWSLAEASGETAHLTEHRGQVGVITELVESRHVLRMAPRRGQTVPLHAGALARTILAFLPPAEIEQILRQRSLARLAPGTPVARSTLRSALAEVRRLGYAVTLEEINAGACGVAAPILGAEGWAVASIGLSGPLSRLTAERRRRLVEPVCRAAQELSQLVRQRPDIVATPVRTLSGGRL